MGNDKNKKKKENRVKRSAKKQRFQSLCKSRLLEDREESLSDSDPGQYQEAPLSGNAGPPPMQAATTAATTTATATATRNSRPPRVRARRLFVETPVIDCVRTSDASVTLRIDPVNPDSEYGNLTYDTDDTPA